MICLIVWFMIFTEHTGCTDSNKIQLYQITKLLLRIYRPSPKLIRCSHVNCTVSANSHFFKMFVFRSKTSSLILNFYKICRLFSENKANIDQRYHLCKCHGFWSDNIDKLVFRFLSYLNSMTYLYFKFLEYVQHR